MMAIFLSPTAIVMFTFAILQQATVKLPNIIAHEKGFKFTAQIQIIFNMHFIGFSVY